MSKPSSRRRLAVAAVAVIVTSTLVLPTPAAATGESDSAPDRPAETVDEREPEASGTSESGPSGAIGKKGNRSLRSWPWDTCLHWGVSDDVHWSHTQPGAISVHAWWDGLNPGCDGVRATVTVELQRYNCYYSNGELDYCRYETIRSRSKSRLWSGGGSSNRVAVHYYCATNAREVSWRARIDVDLEGRWDDSTKWIDGKNNLWCSTY